MKFFALCLLVLSLAFAVVYSAPAEGTDTTEPEGRFFIDYFDSSSSSSSSEEHNYYHYYQVTTAAPGTVPT